uniref:Structure-specific endonuclease subunit SLX4 n=1 Tax=Amblyomma aureolatum TaxID=187763 RepID=A0A1E1XAA1_9ACAR
MDRCAVRPRAEATCPACGDSVAGAMEAHVEKCLQRFSRPSRATDACICVVCRKDITPLDEPQRLAHVNRCLDGEAEEPVQEPVVSTPSRSGAPSFVLLDCPLCERSFKTSEACKNHIKQCSTKLGMSPKQVIEAIRLQQRYVQERMAAGLPVVRRRKNPPSDASAAPRAAKKPRPVASVPKSKYQEEVQMARALSASLTTANRDQEEAQRRFCELLGGSHSLGRKRKLAIKETPLLLLTSADERAQKIEEKIEHLLTQRMIGLELGDLSWCTKLKTVGKLSNRIKELSTKDAPLWSLAGQCRERREDYYVCSLCHIVTPSTAEVGSRLKSLSQVPGRRLSGDLCIVDDFTTLKSKPSLAESTVDEKALNTQLHRDGLLCALGAALSPMAAHSDIIQLKDTGQGFLTQDNDEAATKEGSSLAPAARKVLQNMDSLVGYRRFSDIRIIAEDGCVIPAHRVVLLTRCPAVEKEVSRQGDRVPLLDWTSRSKACVLAFLHYLYSGALDLDCDDRRLHLELRGMAFRYGMEELCEELKDRYFRNESKEGGADDVEADTSLDEILTSFWEDDKDVACREEPVDDDADNVESLEEVCDFLSSQRSPKTDGAGHCRNANERTSKNVVQDAPLSSQAISERTTTQSVSRMAQMEQSSTDGSTGTLQQGRQRPGTPHPVGHGIQSEEEGAWTNNPGESSRRPGFCKSESGEMDDHLESGTGSTHDEDNSSSEELFGESNGSPASNRSSSDDEEENVKACEKVPSPRHEAKCDEREDEPMSHDDSRDSEERSKDADDVWDCVWDGFDDGGGQCQVAPEPASSVSKRQDQRFSSAADQAFTGVKVPNTEEVPREMLDSFFFEEQEAPVGMDRTPGSQARYPGTPARILATPVTPLPDYAAMYTPELQDQLQRFGVRKLPRKKAVDVLHRIYDETHPLVPETPPRPMLQRTGANATDSRDYRNEQLARSSQFEQFPASEEPYHYSLSSSSTDEDGISGDDSDTNINAKLRHFFDRNTELSESILMYEPIDFQKLRLNLKEANIRISSKSLINYLDEQCITFTMPRSDKQQAKQKKRQENFRRRVLGKHTYGPAQHSMP